MTEPPPEPDELARRLFVAAGALHLLGSIFALALIAVALPLEATVLTGALRLFVVAGAASLAVYATMALRARADARRLLEAIRRRAEAPDAPPPDAALVRRVHLMPTTSAALSIAWVFAAMLADATGLAPISRLPAPGRLVAALLGATALQLVVHAMTIRMRRELWGLLRELHPDDVVIGSPQRLSLRLGFRLLSAALVAPVCLAAIVLGRGDLGDGGQAVVAAVLAAVVLAAALFAFRMGQVAERDIRALAAHMDLLLARGPLDPGAVSAWSEEPVRTSAAVELVEATQVLAGRYARLASEEERARRAVEQAHMLRTRFMAYMSHDLRSPLNSITGFAEVLAMESEGPLNEEQMESVLAIRESGQDLVRLVTNLVDAARLEAGRMTIYPVWTAPIDLVEEAIARARRGARSPGPPIRIDSQRGLPDAYVDFERTTQAVSALLFHLARECEGEEPAPIRVHLGVDSNEASAVMIDVQGRGRLDASAYARILEGFSGAERSVGRGASGMGIGLALCRTLVIAQGGLMWCEAADPGETRFRIALPVSSRPLARPAWGTRADPRAFD